MYDLIIRLYGSIGQHGTAWDSQVYITSIRDGVHSITSFHYIGRAIDFKRSGKNKKQLREAVDKFCSDYGIPKQDFDIIEYPELDIFHLEYDSK